MTDPAIRATYHGLKQIHNRKVVQIVLEAPAEDFVKLANFFGNQDPEGARWYAVARLHVGVEKGQEGPATGKPVARKAREEKKLSQRAGAMCNNVHFPGFIESCYGDVGVPVGEGAARWLREQCVIRSRQELDEMPRHTHAVTTFLAIEENFRQWAGYEASPERIPDQARTAPSPRGPSTPPAGSAPVAHAETDPAAEGAEKRQGIAELTPGELMRQVQERDGR